MRSTFKLLAERRDAADCLGSTIERECVLFGHPPPSIPTIFLFLITEIFNIGYLFEYKCNTHPSIDFPSSSDTDVVCGNFMY